MKYKSLSYETETEAQAGAERFRVAGHTIAQVFWTPFQPRHWIVELVEA